jgi:hypothetical protein
MLSSHSVSKNISLPKIHISSTAIAIIAFLYVCGHCSVINPVSVFTQECRHINLLPESSSPPYRRFLFSLKCCTFLDAKVLHGF